MSLMQKLEEEKRRIENDLRSSWCVGAHRDNAYRALERVNKRIEGLKNWRKNNG